MNIVQGEAMASKKFLPDKLNDLFGELTVCAKDEDLDGVAEQRYRGDQDKNGDDEAADRISNVDAKVLYADGRNYHSHGAKSVSKHVQEHCLHVMRPNLVFSFRVVAISYRHFHISNSFPFSFLNIMTAFFTELSCSDSGSFSRLRLLLLVEWTWFVCLMIMLVMSMLVEEDESDDVDGESEH